MNKGNPYKKNNGKFGSATDHDYILYEPDKDTQIEKNTLQRKEVEAQHKPLTDNQKLAKLYNIGLKENAKIDQQVLTTQLDGLKAIADEFPKAQEILKKKYGHGLEMIVEPHGDDESASSFGYTYPTDGIIRLNASSELFKGNHEESIIQAVKLGRKSKWGNSILSTDDIKHTVIHEYGHLLQYALMEKWHESKSETYKSILQLAGIKELPKTLSTYANKNSSEFISEAIAEVFIKGNEASKEAIAVYNVVKKELK